MPPTRVHILWVSGRKVNFIATESLWLFSIDPSLTWLISRSVPNPAPITLYPNSSISRIRISDTDDLIFYLTPSLTISALQPSLAAENSTWGSPLEVGPGAYPGVGSQLSTGTIFQGNYSLMPNMTDREFRGNLAFQVFFQDGESGGLKQFMRRYLGGQWTSTDVLKLE